MGLEIERKYLVHHLLLPELYDGKRMIQGYLSEKPSVRFRISGNSMALTVKEYYEGGRRFELETPLREISRDEIKKLCDLAIAPPVIKVRYQINDRQGLIWEIDVYEGDNSGLITVDIELPSGEYSHIFPPWVNREKDITDDQRYSNLNLGRFPYSRWTTD